MISIYGKIITNKKKQYILVKKKCIKLFLYIKTLFYNILYIFI